MRYLIQSIAIASVLFFAPFYAFSFQDSTRYNRDSLKQEIQFTPFLKPSQRSLGNYVAVVDDKLTFLRSSGISVLNVLRDAVPNTGISINAPFASVRKNVLIVIDGIPYEEGPGIYNSHAFDYRRITMLSRGNAASIYGPYSGNGAVLIESKTGENYNRPSIEFGSFLTSLPVDQGSSFYVSNGLAYMQDFGKFDTRISYSRVNLPANIGNANNIKVNTGFTLSSKFKARFIIDNVDLVQKSNSYSSSTGYRSDSLLIENGDTTKIYYDPYTIETHRHERTKNHLLQGQLALQYQPFRWLTLTSQGMLGKINDKETVTVNTSTGREKDSKSRSLANIFAKIDKRIGSVKLAGFAGVQHQTWRNKRDYFGDTGLWYASETSYSTKSFITGFELNISDFLYGQYLYRKDNQTIYPDGMNLPTYSTSLTFVFSDAFGWQSDLFSFGKIRGSSGKSHLQIKDSEYNFPITPERLNEAGTDLFFFNNRVGLTFNYFKEKLLDTRSYSAGSGYQYNSLDAKSMSTTGSELILTAFPIKNNHVEYKAVVLWTKSKSRVGANTTPGFYGSTVPSWSGGLFNQLSWKNFSWSFLIDMKNGGTLISSGFPGNYVVDGTLIKLRDVSFGWYIIRNSESRIKHLHLSISARNTTLLYASSGRDIEEAPGNYMYDENISLGLNFLL